MYWTKCRSLQRFWFFAAIILFISGCPSISKYQDIQKDFTKAVESDNIQSYDPQMLGTLTTTYQQNYESVLERLNEPDIQKIDRRLHMNAYTMKAISQWRTGKLKEARDTVALAQGKPELTVGPRDKVVLMILPALITDQELTQRYRRIPLTRPVTSDDQGGPPKNQRVPLTRQVTPDDYEKNYVKKYAETAAALKEAIRQFPPDLPEDMLYFVHYQRWRILNNWNIVSTSLKAAKQKDPDTQMVADRDLRLNAYQNIKNNLGASLEDEIQKEKESVPQTNPLWNLMDSFKLPPVPVGLKPPKL